MILVQKGLIYHPVKKSAVHIEMHTQLGLATRVCKVFTDADIRLSFWLGEKRKLRAARGSGITSLTLRQDAQRAALRAAGQATYHRDNAKLQVKN